VFNITGGEVIIIAIIALVILGPDKLPDFVRRAGRVYGEVKKISQGFKTEFRDVIEEPAREMRDTVNLAKNWFEEGKAAVGTMDDVEWNTPITPDHESTSVSLPTPSAGSSDAPAPAPSDAAEATEAGGSVAPEESTEPHDAPLPIHEPFTAPPVTPTPGFDQSVVVGDSAPVSNDLTHLSELDDDDVTVADDVDEGDDAEEDDADDDPNFYDDDGNMITSLPTEPRMDSFGQVSKRPGSGSTSA